MKKALLILLLAAAALVAQVTFQQYPDRLSVVIDGKPFTELFYGPGVRKPFLHPLRSADG